MAGGEGEDTDELPELPTVEMVAAGGVWGLMGQILIHLGGAYLGSYFANETAASKQKESNVAKTFDPQDAISQTYTWDKDGKLANGWNMKDGSSYWDRNPNGLPDEHTWLDKAGRLWSDTGDGARAVYKKS